MTVGRPRREAARVALRIATRWAVLDAHAALMTLADAYLRQAKRHRDTLMADFTYLQPAQPTTLGYLLAGHLQPVLRHLKRLEDAYDWVNRSPAGAGGTTGSSLPLDRERLAARLGFYGVIPHARDAMWQTDGLVDLLATLASVATEAGQVAADLEIWASPGFGFVGLADEYCRVSALMPQKKNPYALAVDPPRRRQRDRGADRAAVGAADGQRPHRPLPLRRRRRQPGAAHRHRRRPAAGRRRVDAAGRHGKALARTAEDLGLVLADLADWIVAHGLGDRRTVHQLLGRAARRAADGGRPVTVDDVARRPRARAASTSPGGPPLAGLDDPRAVLAGRTVTGGWACLGECSAASGRELGRRRRTCTALRSALDGAEAALVDEARTRSAGRGPRGGSA